MENKKRRYRKTAEFHLKMAAAFEAVGKTVDAQSARRAATVCIQRAAKEKQT